ncbi:hypothetical protein C6P96_25375 [Burkholderia multivorans]|nr:hypothetical protein WL98_10050 [Burkholderia multivorans]PRF07846.1 hypothetical protein C6P96_25375 [Burkholderia multivorans]
MPCRTAAHAGLHRPRDRTTTRGHDAARLAPTVRRIALQTRARLPITKNEDEARPPRRRRYESHERAMTDHTTPMPEPPADPNRDPEDDPLSPPSPGHHHDNPQQPDGPPSKDPV